MKVMKQSKSQSILAKSLILALGLVIGIKSNAVIKIDGSSTVFPITEAMAEDFQKANKGQQVTVGISGTGGGFKKFCRGETDIQDASRPIQTSEMEACKAAGIKYVELAIAYDATVVVVNKKNDFLNEISVTELKKMWEPAAQGKIKKWSEINPKWPNEEFKLFGAGADSGTFDYFTEAIVGKAKSSRGDYTASEDDNTLVIGVSGNKNALGYIPMAYYEENKSKLKAIAVIGGEKAPKKTTAVLPSKETVEDGSYFPLSRPIFIYVSEASLKKLEVKLFAEFYLQSAAEIVPTVKYVSLPAKAYQAAAERLKKVQVGTVFSGHSEIGLKIEDLMKRKGNL